METAEKRSFARVPTNASPFVPPTVKTKSAGVMGAEGAAACAMKVQSVRKVNAGDSEKLAFNPYKTEDDSQDTSDALRIDVGRLDTGPQEAWIEEYFPILWVEVQVLDLDDGDPLRTGGAWGDDDLMLDDDVPAMDGSGGAFG